MKRVMAAVLAVLIVLLSDSVNAGANDYVSARKSASVQKAYKKCYKRGKALTLGLFFGIAGIIANDVSVNKCMKKRGFKRKKSEKSKVGFLDH